MASLNALCFFAVRGSFWLLRFCPRNARMLLPGVARKTANVVLAVAFGVIEGVVVDTHVKRLATRMGLTRERTPEKIEQDLMKLIPRKKWDDFSLLLITHGRRILYCASSVL